MYYEKTPSQIQIRPTYETYQKVVVHGRENRETKEIGEKTDRGFHNSVLKKSRN